MSRLTLSHAFAGAVVIGRHAQHHRSQPPSPCQRHAHGRRRRRSGSGVIQHRRRFVLHDTATDRREPPSTTLHHPFPPSSPRSSSCSVAHWSRNGRCVLVREGPQGGESWVFDPCGFPPSETSNERETGTGRMGFVYIFLFLDSKALLFPGTERLFMGGKHCLVFCFFMKSKFREWGEVYVESFPPQKTYYPGESKEFWGRLFFGYGDRAEEKREKWEGVGLFDQKLFFFLVCLGGHRRASEGREGGLFGFWSYGYSPVCFDFFFLYPCICTKSHWAGWRRVILLACLHACLLALKEKIP